ncbi:transcriptional regulator, LacI family [Lentzea albidocapillata subsp. violacea]|uniref:Transcriptional regulator, LacI family n=1 Tax=Lentzea albidocapillata subsp. violacea TaxID=128104 RepID=A0A1G8PZE5_9PSEU|nr:LacI family DNA-binding transcriptional regulator [Lentzea albidocapillata]SDI97899.1 transcriptional regulator, LacI family [Lentzea albidocapillata subsp. violacea]
MTEGRSRRPGPRIEEVARVAGVSKSTVSRVINGEKYVSERSRQAVHRAITLLGYSPSHAARTLAGSKANAIALVISEQGSRVLADPFFAGVLRGVHAELAGRHVQLLLMMNQPLDGEDQVAYLTGGHVDGALVVSLHGDDPLPRTLHETGLPIVVGGRPLAGGAVPFVDADNFNGALGAVRFLISLGREKIATIAGPLDMAVGMDRLSGWRCGLAEHGMPVELVVHSDFTPDSGALAMEALLRRAPDLDAVFVAADIMALGALRVLQERGYRIPDDVAVVGFDDSVLAATAVPPLTTVRQDVEGFGRAMTWRLLAELAGEDKLPQSMLLPTSLVRRASA